ncbi:MULTISPECIES: hypothetical protein [unclassified Haladaptatus]|uniref:hypothetical protein n=1 Tax=unclassified Haladaptatus TaxID=2622732 RepID=UPI0023E76DDD|nr:MULTISPECIES: hypothetical protein [unclassified Haladaptatus]
MSTSVTTSQTGDGYVESLRVEREEFRRVVNDQLSQAEDVEQTSAKLSRFVLVIMGVIASGVGIFPQQFPLNAGIVLGTGLLLVSFVLGVSVQQYPDMRAGVAARHANSLTERELGERQWLERLLGDYKAWVRWNEVELDNLSTLFAYAQNAFILGVVVTGVSLGVALL